MNVLIAEDDLHIREGLKDILDAEGYNCVLAENGSIALEKYQQQKPQLILLDIMMPNVDGYSVCRKIRQTDQETAIIFISAKSEEIDRVLGLELGADDYIMKPFGKHEVIARVRAVTRRYLMAIPKSHEQKESSNETQQFQFNMSDLTINTKELRAGRNQHTIELSLRDCKTLQLLFEKKNQVVTRDALFNHCWGRDYLPNSRTLDQHISQLRKSIETNPKQPKIIKTVHGVGYRFESNN
jgi:DNA-binding response OmpR family regulator